MLIKIFSSSSAWEAVAKGFNWIFLAALPLFVSVDVYGAVVLLSSYIILISNVGLVGQNKVILRFVEKNVTKYIPYNIFISSIGTVTVFLLTISLLNIEKQYYFPLLLVSLLFSNYSLYMAFARKTYKGSEYGVVRLSYTISRLILGGILIVWFQEPIYYLYTELVALLIGLLLLRPRLKQITKTSFSLNNKEFLKSWRFGWPLTIHALSAFLLAFSDRLILSKFLPIEQVGRYTALYTYAAGLSFVYAILAVKWEPSIYRAESVINAERQARQFLKECLFFGVIAGVLVSIVFYVFFIRASISYEGTQLSFLIVLSAHLIMPLYFKMNYLLARLDKTKLITLSSIIAACLNVLLNLYLVPILGIEGAAVATFVSYFLLFVLVHYFYNKSKNNMSSSGN